MRIRTKGKRRYTSCGALGAAALLLFSGCIEGPKPMPPDEALQAASRAITAILREEAQSKPAPPEPAQTPPDPRSVTVWFFSHPLLSETLMPPNAEEAFRRAHPDVRLSRQFIGDWGVAVQKLTVNLAAGDLPDVALVKRSWLARLIPSGRIAALDTLLPEDLVNDLRPPAREALSVEGRLYAWPADGFCSVLYCNRELLGREPPRTWEDLRAAAESVAGSDADVSYAVGHLPYVPLLWSAGGDVVAGDRSALDSAEARETLEFLVSLRDAGLVNPHVVGDEAESFRLFAQRRVAMTVASSAYLPQARALPFRVDVGQVPGKTGPISAMSDNAFVVFRRYAEGKKAAIAEVLDYLSGPDVQGMKAVEAGSVPVRKSVAATVTVPAELTTAYETARGTPLIPAWAEAEFTLRRYLDLAYRWKPADPGQDRRD
jgi:multiple sugar transport system substrate-binding protein